MVQEQEYIPIKDLFNLSSRVAIVTGSAAGIGFGCAKRLAEAGASVTIVDLNEEMGQKSAAELVNSGYKARFMSCDATKEQDMEKVVNGTVKSFGSLDIMVNNAGIYPAKSILEMDLATWDRVMDINLRGVFLGCLKASQQMVKQGRGGCIISTASASAFHPTACLTAYDASKGGVKMLTRTLALELAEHKIRVNSVSPGIIHTYGVSAPELVEYNMARLHRVPWGCFGTPDDVGRVVLFLASPASGYMTGSDVVVDAGWTLT